MTFKHFAKLWEFVREEMVFLWKGFCDEILRSYKNSANSNVKKYLLIWFGSVGMLKLMFLKINFYFLWIFHSETLDIIEK